VLETFLKAEIIVRVSKNLIREILRGEEEKSVENVTTKPAEIKTQIRKFQLVVHFLNKLLNEDDISFKNKFQNLIFEKFYFWQNKQKLVTFEFSNVKPLLMLLRLQEITGIYFGNICKSHYTIDDIQRIHCIVKHLSLEQDILKYIENSASGTYQLQDSSYEIDNRFDIDLLYRLYVLKQVEKFIGYNSMVYVEQAYHILQACNKLQILDNIQELLSLISKVT